MRFPQRRKGAKKDPRFMNLKWPAQLCVFAGTFFREFKV